MALTHNRPNKPFLDTIDLTDVTIPTLSEIDLDRVEYSVDVDLDDLAVFFGDKSTPYFYDELDDKYSLLINEVSDRVIGIVVNRFLTEALKVHPEFIPILRHATIVAGDAIDHPATADGQNPTLLEERRAIFADFANLVGIR